MLTRFEGLLWFVFALLPLVILQRLLHREIQAVFLIISRSPEFTIAFFSIIFLPGVLLHEFSHYLMAVLLGVPAARFSLSPQILPNGRLQLGYVETATTDGFPHSPIGARPTLGGGACGAYVARAHMYFLP